MGGLLFLALIGASPAVPTHVLVRTIERGDILSAADFAEEDRTPAQARGAAAPEALAGREATRRLMAGSVVRTSDAAEPRLVKRGEPVAIHIRSGGLVISTTGRALADGREGDLVRVVATATNRTLDAQVEGSGAVRIAAP